MAGVRRRFLGWAVTIALVMLAAAAGADEPIVVIASEHWKGPDAVSLATLRRLYLGKRDHLRGHRVHCLDLPPGDPVRRGFARTVLEKSERELEKYWIEQALTGGDLPPREVGSAAEMARRVAGHRSMVGYLDITSFQAAAGQGIRVLAVQVGAHTLFPSSPEYPIRYVREVEQEVGEPPGTPPSRFVHEDVPPVGASEGGLGSP